jgi:CRP-like cAMP-binding protein
MIGDRDISAWFMKEGDVVVSVNSFFRQVPSAESIQALEPTTVQYIRYEELEFLYKAFTPFNVHGRRVLTHYYCLSEERAISIRSMKAKDRLCWLLKKEPDLFLRVPRKFIASYLGVCESTFSRINKQKHELLRCTLI